GTPGESALQESIELYRQGKLADAMARLEKATDGSRNPRFLIYRAGLLLLVGRVDEAKPDIERAMALDLRNSDGYSLQAPSAVLGFAYLVRIDRVAAKAAFEKAIALDDADPLPRLGLGLAKIRGGDLEGGRQEIEIAVSLDPGTSLIRSYLGKAYYEEKRDKLAGTQFDLAKQLDPNDPTAWFYDAIRKQTENRSVDALVDMEKSMDLNDNRAVSRS